MNNNKGIDDNLKNNKENSKPESKNIKLSEITPLSIGAYNATFFHTLSKEVQGKFLDVQAVDEEEPVVAPAPDGIMTPPNVPLTEEIAPSPETLPPVVVKETSEYQAVYNAGETFGEGSPGAGVDTRSLGLNPDIPDLGDFDFLNLNFFFGLLPEEISRIPDNQDFILSAIIQPTDNPPVANPDENSVQEDTVLSATGNVLDNDFDLDGDALEVVFVNFSQSNVGSVISGTYGSVLVNSDGSYTYTLNNQDPQVQGLGEGETVNDLFFYTIRDETGNEASSTLNIVITGVNDPPVAVEDFNQVQLVLGSEQGYEFEGDSFSDFTSSFFEAAAVEGNVIQGLGNPSSQSSDFDPDNATDDLLVTAVNGINVAPLFLVNGTWTLSVEDTFPSADDGSFNGWEIAFSTVTGGVFTFSNTDAFQIDGSQVITSPINVTGITDPLANISIRIFDLTHTWFGDLKIDLALPTGDQVSLFSNVLGSDNAAGDLILDDSELLRIQDASGDPISGSFATESGFALRESLFLLEGTSVTGDYGTLYIRPDGQYLYKVDETNQTVLSLESSQDSVQEIFDYTIRDPGGLTSSSILTIDVFGAGSGEIPAA